ncbi:MAG: phosphoribosylpyrophosphate synthetase [Sediminicola sp.]
MENFDTLYEAIDAKKKQGYILDFNIDVPFRKCEKFMADLPTVEYFVDEFYRFEGDSNPDDSSILYAISTSNGHKGLLVSAYGAYGTGYSEIIEKLKMPYGSVAFLDS